MTYYDKVHTINTKQDFLEFLSLLIVDLRKNGDQWENNKLENFLTAMQRWTEDSDGHYTNMQLPVPENVDWKVFADILCGAVVYE
jgi:hypothetical protein